MAKAPRSYGTPVGAEKPSSSAARKKAAAAPKEAVHVAVQKEIRATGRQSPKPVKAAPDTKPDTNLIDTVSQRGKRIDKYVEDAS